MLKTYMRSTRETSFSGLIHLLLLSVLALPCASPQAMLAQSQSAAGGHTKKGPSADKAQSSPSTQLQPATASMASISGTVVDQEGAVAVGAQVQLIRGEDDATRQDTVSGENGQFSFSNLAPGPFRLTVNAPGFDAKIFSGELHAGEVYLAPPIALNITAVTTEVSVSMTPVELAQEEVKELTQQKVLGFIPNYYVSYNADAPRLYPKQKFELAWKSVSNPITILGAATLAGFEQAGDDFSGYGQGAEGYGKRLGATYADVFSATFIGSAILPSLLKQDPRYYYRGTGSTGSRLMYAMANAVMCKGDNKKWQVNYSGIVGSFAASGIGYLYYPDSDRSLGLVIQNSVVRIAESGIAGVFQEFVLSRFTSRAGGKKKISAGTPVKGGDD